MTSEKRLSRFFKDLEEFEDSDEEDEAEEAENQTDETTTINPASVQRSMPSTNSTKEKEPVTKAPSEGGNTKPNSNSDNMKKSEATDTDKNSQPEKSKLQKLPSAHECLKAQSTPEFLKSLGKKEVDWERLEKSLEDDESDVPIDYKSNSVPPPSTYEPVTDPGIKVVDEEGRKRKTTYDDLEDQMTSTKAFKAHPPEETT